MRLIGKQNFDFVFKVGRRISSPISTIFFCRNNSNVGINNKGELKTGVQCQLKQTNNISRLGFVIKRTHLNRAVDRNYMKRMLRNFLCEHQLQGVDIVIYVKKIENFDKKKIKLCLKKQFLELVSFLRK